MEEIDFLVFNNELLTPKCRNHLHIKYEWLPLDLI
jgi:hypothetical protein